MTLFRHLLPASLSSSLRASLISSLPSSLKAALPLGACLAAAMLAAPSAGAANSPSVLDINQYAADSLIVMPESFETDTHKMLENWYLQTYTALDSNVDRRPDAEVSDEEITRRLASIPTTIELPFNSIVRTYIDAYTKNNRTLVENILGMSLYYMPIFEEALEREGLPLELKYLPIIESAMNPDAVSRSGATGLWQLMLPTARGFNLEVNTMVDERRDPVASSAAAAKLLRQLYDIYHDWSLAIAAYNCGPGNVNKALRRCTAEPKDFWAIYPYLPKQTRGYVPCFIAATYVMNFYKEHNISPALAKKPIITDSVHVERRVHFQQIADVLHMPIEELRVLNPQYRQDCIPGDVRPYSLVLPSNQIYSYIMSEDAISSHNADLYARRLTVEPSSGAVSASAEVDASSAEGEWITSEKIIYHKVKKGETMSSIARKYGISLWSLKHANGNISKARRGQTLKVVTTEKVFKSTPVATPPAEGDDLLVKQDTGATGGEALADAAAGDAAAAGAVAAGDASADVASTAGASSAGSAAAASADPKPAEVKKAAPAKKEPAKKTPAKKTTRKDKSKSVTVKSGDSLDKIAKRNGTTVANLKKLNGLKGNNPVIKPGQKLRVK